MSFELLHGSSNTSFSLSRDKENGVFSPLGKKPKTPGKGQKYAASYCTA